jgi:hypothetical protein
MNQTRLIAAGVLVIGLVLVAIGIYIALKPDTTTVQNTNANNTSNGVSSPISASTPTGRVIVPMAIPWTPTGVSVNAGDEVSFTATGKGVWKNISKENPNAKPRPYEECGPDGTAPNSSDYWSNIHQYQMKDANKGALIGKVGENGIPFKIGSGATIKMNMSGVIYFGVNEMRKNVDNASYDDNSGGFEVTVKK